MFWTRIAIILCALSCVLLTSVISVAAPERTTPVRVTNLLGIDPANNTVKAQQNGTWTVGISGTSSVAQSGLWNVGITGTPNVSVTNSPTVKIDSVTNTVKAQIDANANTIKAPTQHNQARLWDADLTLDNGQSMWSNRIDFAGYKELRFVIYSTSSSANLTVQPRFVANGFVLSVGKANFGNAPSHSITDMASFTPSVNTCIFSIPVLSDAGDVVVTNTTGATVTIRAYSWVYMVN